MIQGKRVFRDIGQNLAEARSRLDDIGDDLRSAWDRIEALGEEERRDLAALAHIRLVELRARRIVEGLDAADRRALELMEEKEAAESVLREALTAGNEALNRLDQERTTLRDQRDEAIEEHEACVERIRIRLETTESWQFQSARVEKIVAQAEHVAEKAAQAEEDREEKRRPYEACKLFSYLWSRRYGFSDYQASAVVRSLDGWVARLVRYDRAHLDYRMLLEIPVRLGAYADQVAETRDAEVAKRETLLAEALTKGGADELADALLARERTLAEHEARIDAEEVRRAENLDLRASHDAGEDPFTRQALEILRAHLGGESVSTLRADARRTTISADDRIVARIADRRAEGSELARSVESMKSAQDTAMARLKDLEEIRRRFRHHGYDSSDSLFDDSLRPTDLLGQLLRGGLEFAHVWSQLKQNQRFRARHRPSPGGGSWSFPSFPSSGGSRSHRRSGGGGFRTGGSFGRSRSSSGGFRTGGGF